MVLHHVADRAGLIVESASPLDSEVFGHRDLYALDERTVPERLQHSVFEAKEDHRVDRALAQIMVDAKNRLLVEGGKQGAIQLLRRSKVVPERLLDNHTGVV